MGVGPHRHPAFLPAASLEEDRESLALTEASLMRAKAGISGAQCITVRFEAIELFARGEDIGREGGDVAQRPGQERRDHGLGNARSAVLARVAAARDQEGRATRPRLESNAAAGKMMTVGVEIGDDLQQVTDLRGTARPIGLQVTRIGVEQALVDLGEVERADPRANKLEEAARAVEGAANARWREGLAVAGKIDVEADVQEGAHRFADACILDRVEMDGHVAAPRVLTKHRRAKIPARVGVARELIAVVAVVQWRGDKGRTIVVGDARERRGGDHALASGGR